MAIASALALTGAGAAWACDGTQSGSSAGTYPGESSSAGTYPGETTTSSASTTSTTNTTRHARRHRAHARRQAS